LPHGFGVLLDENFTWVAGQWRNGQPSHPCAAIFGDSDKLYGWAPPGAPEGPESQVSVYEGHGHSIFMAKDTIILNLTSTESNYNNVLIKFLPLKSQPSKSAPFALDPFNRHQPAKEQLNPFPEQLKYVEQRPYSSDQEFMEILQHMLQMPLLNVTAIDFEAFLRNSPEFQQQLLIYPVSSTQGSQNTPTTAHSLAPLRRVDPPSTSKRRPSENFSSDLTISLKALENSITLKLSPNLSKKLLKISFCSLQPNGEPRE
jgi:hypothetical protein